METFAAYVAESAPAARDGGRGILRGDRSHQGDCRSATVGEAWIGPGSLQSRGSTQPLDLTPNRRTRLAKAVPIRERPPPGDRGRSSEWRPESPSRQFERFVQRLRESTLASRGKVQKRPTPAVRDHPASKGLVSSADPTGSKSRMSLNRGQSGIERAISAYRGSCPS